MAKDAQAKGEAIADDAMDKAETARVVATYTELANGTVKRALQLGLDDENALTDEAFDPIRQSDEFRQFVESLDSSR